MKWLATLGAIVFGTLVLTNWSIYHHAILGGPIPLVYYAIGLALAGVVSVLRPPILSRAFREPLSIWFVVYLAVWLVWLLMAGEALVVETRSWRLGLLAFVVFIASLVLSSKADKARLATIILTCALLASANNWLDFLFPANFVPPEFAFRNPGRGAGLFINANQAGRAVVAMVICALPFLRRRYRGLALLVMLAGVYPTFSRAGFLFGTLVAIAAVVLLRVKGKGLALMVLLVPIMWLVGQSLYQRGVSSDSVNVVNIRNRLDFFRSGGQALDESAVERQYMAALTWQMFNESPIVGNGVGSTTFKGGGRGSHNMYLMLGAEQGIVGVLLYLTFVALILRKGWLLFRGGITGQGQDVGGALVCMAAFFGFMGLFSHNLLEEPLGLFLLAFLLAAAEDARRNFSRDNTK